MKRWRVAVLSALVVPAFAGAQSGGAALRTRAESSNYTETSTYADVTRFIHALGLQHRNFAVGSIGKSAQGRVIPYVVASRPAVASPAAARRLGRPIVYVNANIHAGEVEGKEAILALLRDLLDDPHRNALDSVVVVAVPVYNPDGNEAFASQTVNRTEQNGPERVGQRPNGQGLDLNRDYVKAEAPETRGSLAMFDRWDPDVYVDLHTTDGSYHGFALTYAPSLDPAAYLDGFPGAFTRDTMLPELRARMHARGFETFDYGNFDSVYEERDVTDTVKRGWYSYEHKPRYGTNYYGVRGRVSILSEAYSHDPFQRRVQSTYAFVREILSSAARHRGSLAAYRRSSERVMAPSVPIAARITTHPSDAPISFEILRRTGDSTLTQPGVPRGIVRTGRFVTQTMPVYDRFEATRTATRPIAYLVPDDTIIVRLLQRHGLVSLKSLPGGPLRPESFVVDSVSTSPRAFQNHRETRVMGHWRPAADALARDQHGILISATGRLGPLAVALLDPESDDGLLDWNFFDRSLAVGRSYPVVRLVAPARSSP